MFDISPLQIGDVRSALRLSTQAGWNQIEADWLRLIELNPEGCLAGRIDGQLVATATLARCEPRVAWVGMVLVDTACRGQGFGGRIMDAILASAKELGIDSLGLDATDAGRPIYAKRGFAETIGLDRRVLSGESRTATECFGDTLQESDWPALLEMDLAAVRVNRSKLLIRLRQESVVRVTRKNAQLSGFGFRRSGRISDQIGPIVAASPEDAHVLIQSLLTRETNGPSRDLILDTPRDGILDHWLDSNCFPVTRRLTRMVLSDRDHTSMVGPNVFVAAGLELG